MREIETKRSQWRSGGGIEVGEEVVERRNEGASIDPSNVGLTHLRKSFSHALVPDKDLYFFFIFFFNHEKEKANQKEKKVKIHFTCRGENHHPRDPP